MPAIDISFTELPDRGKLLHSSSMVILCNLPLTVFVKELIDDSDSVTTPIGSGNASGNRHACCWKLKQGNEQRPTQKEKRAMLAAAVNIMLGVSRMTTNA